jgi:phospholipid-transporting ATPase
MIQKAHVGVGIAGVEGLQAASSSDYSIGQFKFLQKLLLVHGAWNYNRIGKVILYCFYKNIFFYTIELWFAVDSGFSASILFEQWSIAFYNMAFTATQPLAIGLFEKNVRAEMRMKFPRLYVENQASFSMTIFMMWVAVGLVQSVILYVMCSAIVSHGVIWSNGHDGGLTVLGTCVYTYVIVIASLKAGIEIKAWTWPSHLAIWGSISVWFIFVPLYGAICASIRGLPTDMIGIAGMLYRSYVFWLGLPIVVLVCFIPELTFAVLKNHFASASEEEQRRLEDVLEEDQDSREKLISEGESTLSQLGVSNRDQTRSNLTMSEVEAQEH